MSSSDPGAVGASGGGAVTAAAVSSMDQLLLEAEDFDGDDRDRLIAEYPLIVFDFAGDVGVLDRRRQTEVLQPSGGQRRERLLDAIDQRIENRRRRHIRVARMRIHIELDDERPYRWRAERRHHCA